MLSNKVKTNTDSNLIETRSPLTVLLLKIFGVTVFVRELRSGKVITKFSFLGLFCLVFWTFLWLQSAYKSFAEDQAIIKAFYSTKLKTYGEEFEKILSFIYIVYGAWKIPFEISGNIERFQKLVEIDKVLRSISVKIDFDQQKRYEKSTMSLQICLVLCRALINLVTIWRLGENIPYDRILQVFSTDAMAMMIASHYCNYLYLLKYRFLIVNQMLIEIRDHELYGNKLLVFHDTQVITVHSAQKVIKKQNGINADRINTCTRIYGMLYQTTTTANREFGFALVPTLHFSLAYIILNMFYFMEATSSGLFHDPNIYINFLIYIFWSVVYNVVVIVLIVHLSEITVAEAKKTSVIVHDIINADTTMSKEVTKEAMHLSLQLLHQTPQFTAAGLVNLDYPLLLEGARFLITFLGLLLQYVT